MSDIWCPDFGLAGYWYLAKTEPVSGASQKNEEKN
jgi:hypothetical protein